MANTERPTRQPFLVGLALLVLGVVPAQAQSTPVTTCGQVLSAPGNYHLTGDLGPCRGNGVMITASGVHFTLGGFTISGAAQTGGCNFETATAEILAEPTVGIFVGAAEQPLLFVRVNGGTVRGFFGGILLYGSSSRVDAMTITETCLFGIGASGSRDVIDTNVVTGSLHSGVVLASSDKVTVHSNDVSHNASCGLFIHESHASTIRENIAKGNGGGGVCVDSGNDNVVQGNDASENLEGISVSGIGTIVRDNTAHRNANIGIAIGAGSSGSVVMGNTARSNGRADLWDGNAGCETTGWRNNVFGTDSVAGVSDGGPGTGCVR